MLTVSLGSLQATGDAGATAMTRSLKDFGESSARILLHALSVGRVDVAVLHALNAGQVGCSTTQHG